jgi:alpha-tubulin suppressor-like RCC1 family protein
MAVAGVVSLLASEAQGEPKVAAAKNCNRATPYEFKMCRAQGMRLFCTLEDEATFDWILPSRIGSIAVSTFGNVVYVVFRDGSVYHVGVDLTKSRRENQDSTGYSMVHPTVIAPELFRSLRQVSSVAVGRDFACAIVGRHRSVRCWGEGHYGQLRDGTTRENGAPRLVTKLPAARAIYAGNTFACAIATDNRVYCWGNPIGGEDGTHKRFTWPYRMKTSMVQRPL